MVIGLFSIKGILPSTFPLIV